MVVMNVRLANINPLFTITPLAIFLSSCAQLFYVTNKQNVTLFEEKDEMEFNVAAGTGFVVSSIEIQGAYSIMDHMALQGNAAAWIGDGCSGSIVELAPGYFLPLEDDFVFEIYGGYGKGRSYLDTNALEPKYYPPYQHLNVSFDRYFIQPAFGYSSDYFDVIISSRICLSDFYGHRPLVFLKHDLSPYTFETMNQLWTFEPALTIRGGIPNVKFQMQAIYIRPFESKYLNQSFYESLNFNFSLIFSFGGHFIDIFNQEKADPPYDQSKMY